MGAGGPRRPGGDALAALRAELEAERAALASERAALAAEREDRAAERRQRDAELDVAVRIQRSLMPRVPARYGPWELAVLYRPARSIGGDFYDLFDLEDGGRLGATVADVTGKGLTAALVMGFARAILRSAAYNGTDAVDALVRANAVFERDVRTGLFLSAWMATLEPDGRVRVASAGHEPALVWRAGSRRVTEVDPGGAMLGLFPRADIGARTIRLRPGDTLVAYTDGATDAQAPDGARFGAGRLRQAIASHAADGPAAVIAGIDAAIAAFSPDAEHPADDLTILAIRLG